MLGFGCVFLKMLISFNFKELQEKSVDRFSQLGCCLQNLQVSICFTSNMRAKAPLKVMGLFLSVPGREKMHSC